MTDHVHVYDMQGRCLRSVPLAGGGPDAEAGARVCAPPSVRRTVLELGLVLTDWEPGERVGLASQSGVAAIVRIKPDGMQRNMRAAGVTAMVEDIRRTGASIDAHDAWLLNGD